LPSSSPSAVSKVQLRGTRIHSGGTDEGTRLRSGFKNRGLAEGYARNCGRSEKHRTEKWTLALGEHFLAFPGGAFLGISWGSISWHFLGEHSLAFLGTSRHLSTKTTTLSTSLSFVSATGDGWPVTTPVLARTGYQVLALERKEKRRGPDRRWQRRSGPRQGHDGHRQRSAHPHKRSWEEGSVSMESPRSVYRQTRLNTRSGRYHPL